MLGTSAAIGFFYSVKLIVVTKATLLYNLQPIFITVLAVVILKEKFYIVDGLSLIGAFFGVAILSIKDDTKNSVVDYKMQVLGIGL